tara:strand:+ start:148 stop:522 length:375 start_codon:yes stop_codon:yes gene_type:complete
MTRLLLTGLLVIASLSLAMQFHAPQGLGSRQNIDQSTAAARADSAPYVLAKTAQMIALARKQVPQDSGPDKTPKMTILRDHPGSGAPSGSARAAAVAGFVAEHILFRDGSRTISSRAPPMHFSG